MAAFGKNMKLTLDRGHRDRTRVLFTEILKCQMINPVPDLDAFKLDDGFSLGVYFVDSGALTPEQALLGAWLEFLVDDVDATLQALDALGLARHDYSAVDKEHVYYRAPGGYVFRIAGR